MDAMEKVVGRCNCEPTGGRHNTDDGIGRLLAIQQLGRRCSLLVREIHFLTN